MNREQLEARRDEMTARRAANAKELQATLDRAAFLKATDNTLHGVIQDCEHWLEGLGPRPADPEGAAGAAETAAVARAVREAQPALVDILKNRKAKREGAAASAA